MGDAVGAIGSNPAELTLGATYTDNIGSSSDVDYFQLPQQSKNSKVTIDFTGLSSTTNDLLNGASGEFKLSIVNASDSALASTIKGLSTSLSASLSANTNYYVKLEKGTAFSSSNYSIKASMIETVESEANENVGTADVIVPNAAFTGYLGTSSTASASDVDVYAFTTGTTNGKTVAITVAATASDATFYKIKVTDADGATQRNSNNETLETTVGASNGTLNFTVDSSGNTAPGTYYLWVQANETSSFAASSEATKPYTVTMAGTTDYNSPPTVVMGGAVSGLSGSNNVTSSTTKTVSLNGVSNTYSDDLALSSMVTVSDPDTDSANKTIAKYFLILKDTAVGDADRLVTSFSVTNAANDLTLINSGAASVVASETVTNAATDLTLVNASAILNSAITITSAGNDSGMTFLVTGTNAAGGAQTETITGANAGIATGLKVFKTVTEIDPSATTAAAVTAGVALNAAITITSVGNDSGMTFLVTGTDSAGTALTETITGANAGIATGVKIFKTVTEIDPSATTAAAVTVGVNNSGRVVYDANGNGTIDTAIGGKTATSGSGVVHDLTAAQFATAKYIGAPTTEVGQQQLWVAVQDNNTNPAMIGISTSGFVVQNLDSKDVSVTVVDDKTSALKEGVASTNHTVTVSLPGTNNDGSITSDVRIVLAELADISYGGSDVSNRVITLTDADKSDSFTIAAVDDGSVEGTESVSLGFTVTSSDAAYEGLSVSALSLSVQEVKASFTASALNYGTTVVDNSLKAEGLSNTSASVVNQNANLSINGALSSAASSGFATAQRITITSTGNDSGAQQFRITGTSDGSTALVETVDGLNAATATSTGSFKTVTEIKVLGANTAGTVSAGIASILEGDTGNNKTATYTLTASDFPAGKTLTVNLSSTITSAFDYGTASQSTTREFVVDDDIVSTISSGAISQNAALTLVGGGTVTFTSPHKVSVTSTGNDSGMSWTIVGTNAAGSALTETSLTGATAGNTVKSVNFFKTVTSITAKGGNTAGTVKAGVSDADEAIIITAVAAQDSTNELNPHMPTIAHAIYEGGSVATAYIGDIADKTVSVQDNNVPTASDGTVQTDKQDDDIVSTISSGAISQNAALTLVGGGAVTFSKANKVSITSTGNDSGITWTIVGTNASGSALTETSLTGGNAATVTSTNLFKTVTSITAIGGNTAGTVKAGIDPKITFALSDFGYTDVDGDSLHQVKITALEAAGDLELSGTDVTVNDVISAANISNLTFTAAAGAGGSGYGNFTYQVHDGLQYAAAANTMKVNIGDSVDVNVKSFKQVSSSDVPIKSTAITLKDSSGNVVSGSFSTNTTGVVSFTGVSDGNYTAGFTVTNSTHLTQSIDIYDALAILDYTTGALTPTSNQMIAGNVREDNKLDIYDFLDTLDMSTGAITPGKTVFRDASLSAATYNSSDAVITNYSNVFAIAAGQALTLNTYLLGDIDGDYAGQIA
jgi:hypothetical protein